eukprot:5884322-Pyramimonas_sp.AAC.1
MAELELTRARASFDKLQGLELPPAESEQDRCWPTEDLIYYYLVLKSRVQQTLGRRGREIAATVDKHLAETLA